LSPPPPPIPRPSSGGTALSSDFPPRFFPFDERGPDALTFTSSPPFPLSLLQFTPSWLFLNTQANRTAPPPCLVGFPLPATAALCKLSLAPPPGPRLSPFFVFFPEVPALRPCFLLLHFFSLLPPPGDPRTPQQSHSCDASFSFFALQLDLSPPLSPLVYLRLKSVHRHPPP